MARSRSVIIPINFRLWRLSQTGSEPTSSVFMSLATLEVLSVGTQHVGSFVITSAHVISSFLQENLTQPARLSSSATPAGTTRASHEYGLSSKTSRPFLDHYFHRRSVRQRAYP